jgi:hypothetical protein
MKKIDTTNIAGSAKAPYIKDTHDHYKESIQESTSFIVKGILGAYTEGDLIVLYGCEVTANIPGTSSITGGAIYLSGEIYQVDANASISTPANTLVWGVVTTYIASDSTLEWSDGVIRDLHRIDKLALTNAVTGSGLADYNGVTVKYLSQFIPKSDDVILRTKVVNIGDWNMDTTGSLSVAHGLTLANIRTIEVVIRNDANDKYYPSACRVSTGMENLIQWADATNINLFREAASEFDSVDFDSTSYNRGYITIQYIE